MLEFLNEGKFPHYLLQGRLIPLSKVKGQDIISIEDLRQIVVRSHLCKIIEKAILARLKRSH